MDRPAFDFEERMISLNDVKQLYITNSKKLIRWAALGGILAFLYFGNDVPKYKAEASFREGVERGGADSLVKEIMQGMSAPSAPQAASLMESFQVLRPLVEKMGLQVHLCGGGPRIWSRFYEMWRVEKGQSIPDLSPFVFRNTFYEEERPFSFQLVWTDPDHFTIYTTDREKELGRGERGKEVILDASRVQFTLVQTPSDLKIGVFYPFQIEHWVSAAGGIQDQIKIENDKLNKSLLRVSICHRNRHLAAQMVNELMGEYQNYLKREYDHIAHSQLGYLENRQEQTYGKIEHLFDQHCNYLKQNLQKEGFIGVGDGGERFLLPYQQMENQLAAIEVELLRLDQIEKEGKTSALFVDSCFSEQFKQISQKIQEFKQQRDLLELSLCEISEESLETRRGELKEVRNQRFAVAKLLHEIDQGKEISSFDAQPELSLWAKGLHEPEEKEDFAEYLENYLHLLSLREKMLQERFFYGKETPPELAGIDLISARELFLRYNGKLDAAEASIRHYSQFKKELHSPHFEIASLRSVLTDPLCQKIMEGASLLTLQLKDKNHRSTKEAERWEEELTLQKNILGEHLAQLQKVEELNAGLIREKIGALQRISVDCINQQVSVLYEQINDAIKSKRQTLLLEKKLLTKKMGEIRESLANLIPEKWKFEEWLKIKKELVTKMMETVTEVVETKSIASHLYHVASKPLDIALVPTKPQPPRLYRKSFLGAFVFAFLTFLFLFIRQILKGFPVSFEKLQGLKLPVLGVVSSFCDGPSVETPKGPDLDLLRRLALFTEKGKVIGLIEGHGPDYSYAFCENLARMSIKSVVVRCDFHAKFRKEDSPGLLQIWKGEIGELPIRKQKGFDLMTSGGFSPFGAEIIQSQSFADLLNILKNNYDRVFVLLRSPLSSAESVSILRHCDQAVVTVCKEQTEELTPFIHWAYDKEYCRLTFVACS